MSKVYLQSALPLFVEHSCGATEESAATETIYKEEKFQKSGLSENLKELPAAAMGLILI